MQYDSKHFLAAAIVLVALSWAPAQSAAQSSTTPAHEESATAPDLVAMTLAAKEDFHPLPPNRLAKAQQRLQAAIRQLDGFLATGTKENAVRWRQYLRWDEMNAELEKPDGPNMKRLGQILGVYYRNFTSLEHPSFMELRASLSDYRIVYTIANDRQMAERYAKQLDRLADLLVKFDQKPTLDRSQAIGTLVRWLELAGQAKELVAAIRSHYWQPNLYVVASQRVVNSGLTMEVTQTEDVRDCILGTTLVGTATMQGHADVELIDSDDDAQLRVRLIGTIHSDNVGFNRGVKINSRGDTQVLGTKIVRLNAAGITAAPAQVHCTTSSTIDSITARSCLIEKIAWKRAARSKASAERIGSRHAEQRVAVGMEKRANKQLERARDDYAEKFRKPLLRRDQFPQELKFRTIGGLLKIVWRQANASQLAAPDMPPPIEGKNDLAVRLHESFVSNFSRAMLGGVRLTDKRLVELLEKNMGEVPEAVRLTQDKEPWAITFSPQDPVSATFANNTIRFAIRGRVFELGERTVRSELEMSAVYQLQKTPAGAHLTRQGGVSVEYVGATRRRSSDEVIVRTVMRQKFDALFAPEFTTTGIPLPGSRENTDRENTNQLHLEHLAADNGWLGLAWTQVKGPATVTQARNAQAPACSSGR